MKNSKIEDIIVYNEIVDKDLFLRRIFDEILIEEENVLPNGW